MDQVDSVQEPSPARGLGDDVASPIDRGVGVAGLVVAVSTVTLSLSLLLPWYTVHYPPFTRSEGSTRLFPSDVRLCRVDEPARGDVCVKTSSGLGSGGMRLLFLPVAAVVLVGLLIACERGLTLRLHALMIAGCLLLVLFSLAAFMVKTRRGVEDALSADEVGYGIGIWIAAAASLGGLLSAWFLIGRESSADLRLSMATRLVAIGGLAAIAIEVLLLVRAQ